VFSLSQFEASLSQATDSCRSVSSTCYEPGVPLLFWEKSRTPLYRELCYYIWSPGLERQ